MAWNLEYDSGTPPLPGLVRPELRSGPGATQAGLLRRLRDPPKKSGDPGLSLSAGCWDLRLRPRLAADRDRISGDSILYAGTLRVEWQAGDVRGARVRASGDLYLLRNERDLPQPNRFPIYPIASYRYYLSLVALTAWKRRLELEMEVFRFDARTRGWLGDGRLRFELDRDEQDEDDTGQVRNERRTVVGTFERRHVGSDFRQATVAIARAPRVDAVPRAVQISGQRSLTLEQVFAAVDWRVTVVEVTDPDFDPAARRRSSWSRRHLHEHLLRWRRNNELRTQRQDGLGETWNYYLLCVRSLAGGRRQWGVMFDTGQVDSDDIPREGAAIASHARVPVDAAYDDEKGKILSRAKRLYFRTAVHELGHAMGLAHNDNGVGFMRGTTSLASSATADQQTIFEHLAFEFDPEDATRLRHLPDIWVRPGGVPALSNFSYEPVPVDDLAAEVPGLELELTPLSSVVPLGAPVRVTMALRNTGSTALDVPSGIGLTEGRFLGRVSQPGGITQTLGGVTRLIVDPSPRTLAPGQELVRSETLLRGRDGALFPAPGVYELSVDILWDERAGLRRATASTSVLITEPGSPEHSRAALAVLAERELMLPLVFRSNPSELEPGREVIFHRVFEALDRALANPTLGPHYAVTEARRLGRDASRLAEAARWIDSQIVMTGSEIASLAALFRPLSPLDPATTRVRPAIRRLIEAAESTRIDRLDHDEVAKLQSLLG